MIANGILHMFNTPISHANTEALALEDSLEKTVAAADSIGRVEDTTHLGLNDIVSGTSQLAKTLGAAASLPDLRSKTANLSSAVGAGSNVLGDKFEEAEAKVADVVSKTETAINSWENVHDLSSLERAVSDTGRAAASLGGFLEFVGAIVTIFNPPVGAAIIAAGVILDKLDDNTQHVVQQTQALIDPSKGGQTQGQTEGQTEGETEGQTEGQTEGETEGETEGQTEGETQGETEGQTQGETEGQTEGETQGETQGQTQGETEGQTEGETEGQTQGQTQGETQGETEGQTEGQTQGETGTGTDAETGTGTDFQTGTGTDIETGTGTDFQTGTGTDVETGIGTDFQTGTGTDFSTGIGTDISIGTDLGTELEVQAPEPEMNAKIRRAGSSAGRGNTRQMLEKLMRGALHVGDLARASSYADEYAFRTAYELRHEHYVSISKLQHDIDQLEHLRAQGVQLNNMTSMIDAYRQVMGEALRDRGPAAERWRITDAEYDTIGSFYNRIIHRPETERVPSALSPDWDPSEAEVQFLEDSPGVATIDGFLSPTALEKLRRFCLESVIWVNNRYAYGRLGTVFARGFNCPLLVQIGEEISRAFPNIIDPRHQLRQVWAFKNGNSQPCTAPHADFAAVNVNIWLTPDSANLDPATGGLEVYNVEAPPDWDFRQYNSDGRAIKAYLRDSHADVTTIPYRANRAIIFNSDLFHATQPLSFNAGYANRRLNVTFLFGLREEDATEPRVPGRHRVIATPLSHAAI